MTEYQGWGTPGGTDGLRATARPEDAPGLVRKFVEQELIPIEMQISTTTRTWTGVLKPLQEKVKALGLWLLDVPKEYGGLGSGCSPAAWSRRRSRKSKALPFRHNELFGPTIGPILYACNAEQRERFLYPVHPRRVGSAFAQTEPDAGADPGGMRTRAVRDGDHYVLNGAKRFITDAGSADYCRWSALTDPEKRAARRHQRACWST